MIEPLWWTEARGLRAEGLSILEIAAIVGRHHSSVLYAINEEYRRKHLEQAAIRTGRHRKVEPLWWARARELRECGHRPSSIGRFIKKNPSTVKYALDEEFRTKKQAARPPRLRSGPRNPGRESVVNAAKAEAVATGRHVDEILVAWGDVPRFTRRVAA